MAADAARARLQAWRAQGAERLDPLRFAVLESLAARAPQHAGRARELLEQRLSGLLGAYAEDLARVAAGERAATGTAAVPCSALGGLLAHMARPAATADAVATGEQAAATPADAELPMLDELRAVWSRLRNDSQLRESLEQVPADAGPLNSDMLVHRALQLMQSVSPGYLQEFIAYADTLSSLQPLRESAAGAVGGSAAAGARRQARPRPRKRAG